MTTVVDATLYDCRDAFASTLESLAESNSRVVAVVNDSVGSSKLGGFATRFPDRIVNVGIAEQNLVGVAAGLANGGKRPFVAAASCFLTARALEQIKADLAYSNAAVTLCAMSPGVAYGQLGATHHSIEDVAWLRAIANMTIVVPSDPTETVQALTAAANHDGPVFVRVSRMPVPAVNTPDYRFELGRAVRVKDGVDVTVIANGTMVSRALEAAALLDREGIDARVVSMPTVKPLDIEEVEAAAAETAGIVTVEEHTIRGGLGGAVAEHVVSTQPVPMRILGVPDVFAPTGDATWLLDYFGLNAEGISVAVRDLLEGGQRDE